MSAIHHLTGFFTSMYDEFKRSYQHYPVLSYYALNAWSRGGRLLRYLSAEQWALIVDVMKEHYTHHTRNLDSWPNKIVGYLYEVLPSQSFEQVKLLLCPTCRGVAKSCHTWAVDTGCLYCHMDAMAPTDLEAQVAAALMARWENMRVSPRYDLNMQNSSLYRRRRGLDLDIGEILC